MAIGGGLDTFEVETEKKKKKSWANRGGRTILKGYEVALVTLDRPIWDGQSLPCPLGWFATLKAQTIKKKKKKFFGRPPLWVAG